jgi:hypothetical protein
MWFMKKSTENEPEMDKVDPKADPFSLSYNPTFAWEKLKSKQPFEQPQVTVGRMTSPESSLRVVCVSDTHGKHRGVPLPKGDILVHCGDFTDTGKAKQV